MGLRVFVLGEYRLLFEGLFFFRGFSFFSVRRFVLFVIRIVRIFSFRFFFFEVLSFVVIFVVESIVLVIVDRSSFCSERARFLVF